MPGIEHYKLYPQEKNNDSKDLHRAGIEPFAWVINQSLTSVAVSDPVLLGRQAQESRYIDEVCQIAGRIFLVPCMAAPLEAAKL